MAECAFASALAPERDVSRWPGALRCRALPWLQLVPRRAVHLVVPTPPIGSATHVLQVSISDKYVIFELPDTPERHIWYALWVWVARGWAASVSSPSDEGAKHPTSRACRREHFTPTSVEAMVLLSTAALHI